MILSSSSSSSFNHRVDQQGKMRHRTRVAVEMNVLRSHLLLHHPSSSKWWHQQQHTITDDAAAASIIIRYSTSKATSFCAQNWVQNHPDYYIIVIKAKSPSLGTCLILFLFDRAVFFSTAATIIHRIRKGTALISRKSIKRCKQLNWWWCWHHHHPILF